MRRSLILITLAAGTLLLGCSSTEETSTPPTTTGRITASSVDVIPANEAICADLQAFTDLLLSSEIPEGGTPEETAAAIQAFFVSTLPSLEVLKTSAPADLAPTVDTYIAVVTMASELDPTNAADQQTLGAMLLAPNEELATAERNLRLWAAENCGITLPGGGN